jgi:hypothetical protein
LEHFEAALRGETLYRARDRLHAAACRPIGLREDQCDFVTRVEQACERPRGEFRSTGER